METELKSLGERFQDMADDIPLDQWLGLPKTSARKLVDHFYIEARKSGYEEGYIEALEDYGIWKDGVRRIGCLETPIKEIIHKKFGK